MSKSKRKEEKTLKEVKQMKLFLANIYLDEASITADVSFIVHADNATEAHSLTEAKIKEDDLDYYRLEVKELNQNIYTLQYNHSTETVDLA